MIYIAVVSTIILILLILIWLRARWVRCRGCLHFQEQYITALHGQGLFRFGYCQRLVHDCKIVEPDIERECKDFEEKEIESIPEEVTQPDTKAAEGHKKKRPRNPKVSIFNPGKRGK